MRRPHADVVGLLGAEQVGLGWYLAARDGRTFLSHGGATNGQQARLVVVPEERFAFAALTNHDDGGALGGELLASVLEGVLGIEPAATPEHLERAPAELAGYAGTYEAPLTRLEVTVKDGGLVLDAIPRGGFPRPDSPPSPGPPPTRLAFEKPDFVVALDPPMRGMLGDFLRGPDGEIVWFRVGGRLHRPR